MIEDYQSAVLAEYRKLKEMGSLSCDLSTRAKFRAECLKVFNKRYHPNDDDVFAEFFGIDKIGANFGLLLKRSEADDFKAVHNHIAGYNKTDNTDIKNTELLAWFIDFRPRPSIAFYNNQRLKLQEEAEVKQPEIDVIEIVKEIEVSEGEGITRDAGNEDETKGTTTTGLPRDGETNPGEIIEDVPDPIIEPDPRVQLRHILLSCSIFLILGIGIYQFRENKAGNINSISTLFSSGNEKCMYWNGNSYQPVSCDENLNGIRTLPIDENKVRNFKRIMQPDTLTGYALGKFWYTKRYGQIEFYTDSGSHPTDDNKRLLPVSTYIINKYTSYQRYFLTVIYWFAGILFFSLVFGMGTVYMISRAKKFRSKNKKGNQPEEAPFSGCLTPAMEPVAESN